jgi:hypothetical protein
VPLGNLASIVGYLLKAGFRLDLPYWRKKLTQYAADLNENGVLQRHALLALESIADPTIINDLPDLAGSNDDSIGRAFLSLCTTIAPDSPKSVEGFIKATKRNKLTGRYGLYAIKNKSAIKRFLEAYIGDDIFREEFLDDNSIFGKRDIQLIQNIDAIFDEEISELCRQASIKSFDEHIYDGGKVIFVIGLLRLLKTKDPCGLIPEILTRIQATPPKSSILYWAQGFLAEIIQVEDVPNYLARMIAFNETDMAMSTMRRIKNSKREFREQIYEAGRVMLPHKYTEWEKAKTCDQKADESPQDDICLKEFRKHLEPEPGMYSTGLFAYYKQNSDNLDRILTEVDKTRFKKLIVDAVLKIDPAEFGHIETDVDKNGAKRHTHSSVVPLYGDALYAAKQFDIDIQPYRKNILRYIPFVVYTEELKLLFDLIPKVEADELSPILEIYTKRTTDLWKYQPGSFIETAKEYNLVEAASVLRGFVKEQSFRLYDRKEALAVSESLDPNSDFLGEVFSAYIDSKDNDESELARVANELLITVYAKRDAVAWRLEQIKKRITPYTEPPVGVVHEVGLLDEEMQYKKPFAKALLALNKRGFEKDYLELLDLSVSVWGRGKGFYRYAQYLWEIVFAYFENLKDCGSYDPLRLLEERVSQLGGREGANWMASGMVKVRRAYLNSLGKPNNISEAVAKYNEVQAYGNNRILNSVNLFTLIKDVIATDLRNWIEGEGAYRILVAGEKYKGGRNDYENLVQKTLKAQLENLLMKRGFQAVDFTREPQLLNDKRVDFLIRYGFIGPIALEVKLSSNSDLQTRRINETKSYTNMEGYMQGYGAPYGIFLIINNTGAKTLSNIITIFEKIPNVWATALNCQDFALTKKKPAICRIPTKATKKHRHKEK